VNFRRRFLFNRKIVETKNRTGGGGDGEEREALRCNIKFLSFHILSLFTY
jgi:hypothetical protein